MTADNLKEILKQHKMWLGDDATGKRAILREANLTKANLSGANITWAILSEADLRRAVLAGADLTGANLSEADLSGADLSEADLSEANLTWADLTKADLTEAKLPRFQICPQEGSFIAYKALAGGATAKLRIPETAARTSLLVGRKCRAEFVEVLELTDKTGAPVGQAAGRYDPQLIYVTGQTVHPDSYDHDVRLECTHGIHFFMTREEAEEY